jgi:hypothetical protein
MSKDGKVNLSQMARIDLQLAELDGETAELCARKAELLAERSRILSGMADNDVSLETGRKVPARHVPKLGPVSELDRQRARVALAACQRRTAKGTTR